jgi:RHS repeat-associated protein
MRINKLIFISLLTLFILTTAHAAEPTVVQKEQVVTKAELVKQQIAAQEAKDGAPTNDVPAIPIFDSNHNDLYRSYVNTHDITQVDPFSGNMTVRLPLLNIPGNDHLPLQVTLLFDNTLLYQITPSTPGYGWAIIPGIYTTGTGFGFYEHPPEYPYVSNPTYIPVFLAPDGTRHSFYSTDPNCSFTEPPSPRPYPPAPPCDNINFVSKDNWHANLNITTVPGTLVLVYAGTISSPDGVSYQIVNMPPQSTGYWFPFSPLATITSANHGTILTYHYDANNGLINITRNDGFSVNFTNTLVPAGALETNRLDQMQTSDGHTWHFAYENIKYDFIGDETLPTLTTITLPNNTQWQFQPVTNGLHPLFYAFDWLNIQLNSITSPTGLITTFTYGNNYIYNPIDTSYKQYYSSDRLAVPYVLTKTLSSPSIATATWNYDYAPMTLNDGTFYYSNTTTITGPTNKIVDTFDATQNGQYPSIDPDGHIAPLATLTSGLLLDEIIYDRADNQMQDTKYTWGERELSKYPPFNYTCMNYPVPHPWNVCKEIDGFPTTMTAPELQQKTITRDGATYTTTYSNYDQYGYPAHIVQSSAAGSFNEDLTYYEDATKWIFKPQNDTISDGSGVANSITRQFDANGNMTQQTTNGVVSNYAYDASGNLTSHTDAANNATTFANYVAGTPETTTDAMGGVTKRDVNTDGTVNSVTDPNNFTTSYTYDPLYRLANITPPEGLPTTLVWNDSTVGTSLIMTRGDSTTSMSFDSVGNNTSVLHADATFASVIRKFYNADNLLVHENYPSDPSTAGGGIDYTYDTLDRLSSITDGGNFTTHYYYSGASEKNAGLSQVDIVTPNNYTIVKLYRAFGDPDQTQLMETQEGPKNTDYTRTLIGLITNIKQSTQAPPYTSLSRQYNYDAHHYLVSEVNPETGTTTYGRDILGSMISKQIGSMSATTYEYDKLNRLTATGYNDLKGAQSILRQYDNGSRLIGIHNSSNSNNWAYTYDPNNNLTNADLQITSVKNADYNFGYSYDGYDHLHTMTYPDGTELTYSVSPVGHILDIAPYIRNVQYFSDDTIQSFNDNNGVTTTYTENDRLMRDSIIAKNNTTTVLNKNYNYDGMGNVTNIIDNLDPTNNQSFTYNNYTNDLREADGPWGNGVFYYDAIGNILSNTAGNNIQYTYNTNNLLTRTTGSRELNFSYDAAGDMTNIGGLTLTYNSLQQVSSMTGASVVTTKGTRDRVAQTYWYDGNGNRVQVNDAVNSTNTFEMYNLKSQLLYKDVPTTNTHDLYIMLAGQTVAHIKKVGTTPTNEFYHNDLLGSPAVTTNYQAQSIWTQRYLPYGEQMDDVINIDKIHTGYTGKPHDNDSDLSYYGARYYFPFIGRFISPDPAAVNPEMPITFNRYAYAANNPYKYVDPDGRLFGDVAKVGVIGVSAIAGGAIGYHYGGKTGAVVGFALGALTAGTEPAAVATAARVAVRLGLGEAAQAGAQAAASIGVQTASNMVFNQAVTGHPDAAGSLFAGTMGGIASVGVGTLAKGVMGGSNISDGILHPSLSAKTQSNISSVAGAVTSSVASTAGGAMVSQVRSAQQSNNNTTGSNSQPDHNNTQDLAEL